MNEIRVWAPKAERVELLTSDLRLPFEAEADGYFRLRHEHLRPGLRYSLSLDGGPPLADPRSRAQVSLHGESILTCNEAFDWSDAHFLAVPLAASVIYELHVGTFAADGSFDGVIQRLPHLRELGVTHIELMPVAQFPGQRGWGYDGAHLYAPHPAYGGGQGLKRLVDACHAQRIAVLLDVVYNHLGPDGCVLPAYGPFLTQSYQAPWGSPLNLDGPGSREVRRFLIDNALYWLREYHIDGLRLDAVHTLFDLSARHFLEELAQSVDALAHQLAKPLVLIAESDSNDPRLVRAPEAGGFGLDAQWCDDFHHALYRVLTNDSSGINADFDGLPDLAHSLQRGFVYEGKFSKFRQRQHGRPLAGVPLRRMVGFLENHDQAGNRSRGQRIGHLVPPARARLGALLVLLGPFIPLLFQGEEWNAATPFCFFTDHHDPVLAKATTEGRRREFAAFGWKVDDIPDPQQLSTFERSQLNFEELRQPEARAMFEFYQRALRLRRSGAEFHGPFLRVQFDERRQWLRLERERSTMLLNFGPEALTFERARGALDVALSLEGAELQEQQLVLPPNSALVLVHAG